MKLPPMPKNDEEPTDEDIDRWIQYCYENPPQPRPTSQELLIEKYRDR